jgi:hypothetical protein
LVAESIVKALLDSILTRIADGTLLPPPYYSALDCDAAVDARDGDSEFDLAWVCARNHVDRLWDRAAVGPDQRKTAEDIRREGFLAVGRVTGQHEIASHVSDDLDLVLRARLAGLNEPFLERLWRSYDQGEFPGPLS